MTNKQFIFSFSVGIAMALFGGYILSMASVGLSLIAVGAGIAVLALVTKHLQTDSQDSAVPVIAQSTQPMNEASADYQAQS